jgi:hypothetical protein
VFATRVRHHRKCQHPYTAEGKEKVMDPLEAEDEQEYDDPSWYNTD